MNNSFFIKAAKYILIPLLSVLAGFLLCAVILIISDYDPVEAYSALFQGAGFYGDIERFGNTLLSMTTLILTGLSVTFAFKTGLFNIGASGQMLMGGFAAVLVGVKLEFPKIIHLPIAVATAIIVGGLWALLPGILKAVFRIHEVVTTIMMNWIAYWSVYYFVPTLIPGTSSATESSSIQQTASLRVPDFTKDFFNDSYVNLGLLLSLISIVIIWWVLDKTTFGYELKAAGYNSNAAKYAGMKVNRNIILSMMISGALAGLAGATFYLGYADNIKIGVLPSQGFDGIAVALLGSNSPFGILISAFILGFMDSGKIFMNAATDVPNELISIILGIIVFFAATTQGLRLWLDNKKKVKK